jgi:hypothetical protein
MQKGLPSEIFAKDQTSHYRREMQIEPGMEGVEDHTQVEVEHESYDASDALAVQFVITTRAIQNTVV